MAKIFHISRFTYLLHALLLAAILFCNKPSFAQSGLIDGNKFVKTSLISDQQVLQPRGEQGEVLPRIGVLFEIEPGWHIYWKNSGEAAIPTKIDYQLPAYWRVGETKWPLPSKFIERGNIVTYGYSKKVLLFADLIPPQIVPSADESVKITANISWLVCKDICIPGRTTLEHGLQFSSSQALTPSPHISEFQYFDSLRPHTLLEARARFGLKSLEISSQLIHQSLSPNQESQIILEIRGLKDTTLELASHLQVFAEKHPRIKIASNAEIVQIDQEGGTILSVPIQVGADAKSEVSEINGVIALSATLFDKQKDDIAISWRHEVEIRESLGAYNPMLINLLEAGQKRVLLNFRQKTYKESEAQAANDKPRGPKSVETSESVIGLPLALLFAFLGGLFLNLMPCVLPVLSIKVMSFIGTSKCAEKPDKTPAIAFSCGILFSFLTLATAIVALKAGGQQLGWGFQFQHPEFVLGLAVVVFILALGFFDAYALWVPYLCEANKAVNKLQSSFAKNFFDGILTTALATPCTAPFLGAALVFALSQPALYTFLIFTVIGIGLSLPYAYLSTHPALLERLPKPGAWMYRLRQFMGFLLFGTVIWLLYILHMLTNDGVIWTLVLLLSIYVVIWAQSWAKESGSIKARAVCGLVNLCILSTSVYTLYPRIVAQEDQTGTISWQAYSDELVSKLRQEGNAVFIDFTAEWCITCKANEKLTIETSQVAAALEEFKVQAVKADWTRADDSITKALKRYGAEGVPLYVVLGPDSDSEPIILSTLPTKGDLIAAFKSVSN